MSLTDRSPFFSGSWQTLQSVSETLSDVQTLEDKHEEGLHVTIDYCCSVMIKGNQYYLLRIHLHLFSSTLNSLQTQGHFSFVEQINLFVIL